MNNSFILDRVGARIIILHIILLKRDIDLIISNVCVCVWGGGGGGYKYVLAYMYVVWKRDYDFKPLSLTAL